MVPAPDACNSVPRNDSRELELHHDHVYQRCHRRPARFNHEMGSFTVQGITFGIQLAQTLQGIGYLQQGTLGIVPQTSQQLFRHGLEVDHLASRAQTLTVDRAEYGTATRGQHAVVLREFLQDLFLDVAKAIFTFTLEKLPDRTSQSPLDQVIRIGERKLQSTGELAPDRRLSRARQTDQTDQQLT